MGGQRVMFEDQIPHVPVTSEREAESQIQWLFLFANVWPLEVKPLEPSHGVWAAVSSASRSSQVGWGLCRSSAPIRCPITVE